MDTVALLCRFFFSLSLRLLFFVGALNFSIKGVTRTSILGAMTFRFTFVLLTVWDLDPKIHRFAFVMLTVWDLDPKFHRFAFLMLTVWDLDLKLETFLSHMLDYRIYQNYSRFSFA